MKRLLLFPLIAMLWAGCTDSSTSDEGNERVSQSPPTEEPMDEPVDSDQGNSSAESGSMSEETRMSGAKLEAILRDVIGEDISVNGSVIEFVVQDIPLACVYDEAHNRMRIVSPVKSYSEVSDEEKDLMFQANFHSALDARYAVSGNVVYAAFIHPLSSLTEVDFLSGILQVASLTVSFGDSYSSGVLQFQGRERGPSA